MSVARSTQNIATYGRVSAPTRTIDHDERQI